MDPVKDLASRIAAAQAAASSTAAASGAAPGSPTITFLSVLAGERPCVLPLSAVTEIAALHDLQVTPLPNLAPPLLGVVSIRGQLVPVGDLGPLLGGRPGGRSAQARLVVCRHEGSPLGLLVDEVLAIVDAPSEAVVASTTDGQGSEGLVASVLVMESQRPVLDVAGAWSALRRLVPQREA